MNFPELSQTNLIWAALVATLIVLRLVLWAMRNWPEGSSGQDDTRGTDAVDEDSLPMLLHRDPLQDHQVAFDLYIEDCCRGEHDPAAHALCRRRALEMQRLLTVAEFNYWAFDEVDAADARASYYYDLATSQSKGEDPVDATILAEDMVDAMFEDD